MSHRTPIALVLTTVLLSSGCATLQNVKRPCTPPPENPDAPVCRIYGGVRSDWATMSEYPLTQTTHYADYVVIPLMMAGDLFFVTIGDTITLPYTGYEEIRRAYFPPEPAFSSTLTETQHATSKILTPTDSNAAKPQVAPSTATPVATVPATGGH